MTHTYSSLGVAWAEKKFISNVSWLQLEIDYTWRKLEARFCKAAAGDGLILEKLS